MDAFPSSASELAFDAVRRAPAYRAVRAARLERAGIACSGGADSSALVALVGLAQARGDASGCVVLHVDHRTRPDSAAEADRVQALATRFELPFRALTVPQAPSVAGSSPEAALREARYAALAMAVTDLNLTSVVTAHTLDDQVETVLLRLLAGTGALGAAGMRRAQHLETPHGTLLVDRPLLEVTRAELRDLVVTLGIVPFDDPTNADPHYRRNLLRHNVLPALHDGFPGFSSALLRSVELAARDADLLDELALQEFTRIARSRVDEVALERRSLRDLHPAIASRVLRLAAEQLIPGDRRELTFERVEALLHALAGRSGAVIELPYGVVALVERDVVRMLRREAGEGVRGAGA